MTSVGPPWPVRPEPGDQVRCCRFRAEEGWRLRETCNGMQQLIAGAPKIVGAAPADRRLTGTAGSRIQQIIERAGVVVHPVRVRVRLRRAIAAG
jgi:hypothetical protein